ncbi:hypothetical protein [Actinokineospora sp. NPDC004072]
MRTLRSERRHPLPRPARPHWLIAIGVVIAVVIGVVAFLIATAEPQVSGPRALTADEANRLAITRFRNFEAGGRAVSITVPTTAGGLAIRGSVDFRAGLGYGVVRGIGRDASSNGLIQWTSNYVFVHPLDDIPAEAPHAPPATGWHQRPLQKAGSTLDSALLIALSLGSDRPDNAALLPQNGAEWVGRDQIGDQEVDIMSGPAARGRPGTAGNVRYWVDANGAMHRVQADVASEPQPVVIEFDTQAYVPVQPAPGVTPSD